MKLILLKTSAGFALVVLLCTAAWGQGEIKGTVTNEKGEVVPKATVTIKNDEINNEPAASMETASDGTFHLPSLQTGRYTVTVSAPKGMVIERVVEVKDGKTSDLKIKLVDKHTILIPYLINLLCGAVILILLDIWLRRRGVKDPSLIWLYVSLLSWAVAIGVELLDWKWLQAKFGIPPERVKYLFSIVSSVLFIMTAFQLSRVRDRLPDHNLRLLRKSSIIAITLFSLSGWVLQFTPYSEAGNTIDALASSMAGFALGWGLSYSFYKYGNNLLVGLTVLTFTIFIWRQFYLAQNGTPTSGILVPFFLANSTMLIMLFIALAVAWALSDTSRLKPVAGSSNVQIIAMFFDLRGSTRWANDIAERDFNYVRTFIDELREWAWSQAATPPHGRPNLVKFLGDGFMFVWEIPNDSVASNSNAVIELANTLCTNYRSWVKEESFKQRFPWGVPIGIGLGVDVGPAIRLTFENGSDDYLGSPVNIAAKMQHLARPDGGGVIQAKVWHLLTDRLRGKFPKEGMMKLGDRGVYIRVTEDVEL